LEFLENLEKLGLENGQETLEIYSSDGLIHVRENGILVNGLF